jgi:Rrf2 family transcriptional regulator, nitric oxide-sensitive transcriptional repressor
MDKFGRLGDFERVNLNLRTDYSLRLLVYLSVHPGETVTVARVAAAYGISSNHLTKVAQALGTTGVIELVRGRSGGVRLAKAPEKIGLGQVVRRVEGDQVLVECFDPATNTCIIAPVCALKRVLREAQQSFYAVLDRYTLADVAGNPDALRRIFDQRA